MMRWLLPQELIQYCLIIIICITVPVTTVTFPPSGDNNVVDNIERQKQTFTCTTYPIRPAAWILWYIGGQNVTNHATPHPPQEGVDKLISSSILVYKGRGADHSTVIFCEAANIEGRPNIKSTEMSLNILCKLTFIYIIWLTIDHGSINLIE